MLQFAQRRLQKHKKQEIAIDKINDKGHNYNDLYLIINKIPSSTFLNELNAILYFEIIDDIDQLRKKTTK